MAPLLGHAQQREALLSRGQTAGGQSDRFGSRGEDSLRPKAAMISGE
jgi:hypothetical protein